MSTTIARILTAVAAALALLSPTVVPLSAAEAATRVGIGEPRVIATTADPGGNRATLGVRVRSTRNVHQVRIDLFTTSPSHEKRTVIAQLRDGSDTYGYWTGTTTFADDDPSGWRIEKVRVLGRDGVLLRSKSIGTNTAAVLVVHQGDLALVVNGRTRGPESARTVKFALKLRSDDPDHPYADVPVRLSPQFRRPSGMQFVRSIAGTTDDEGNLTVTFGPYRMARVRGLGVELPDPDGGSVSIFFGLR